MMRQPSQGFAHVFPNTRLALLHDYPVLRPESSQTVDLGSTKLDQSAAHAMQRQDGLLCFTLYGCSLDTRLLYRRPDGPGVMGIALVAAHERLDHLPRQ